MSPLGVRSMHVCRLFLGLALSIVAVAPVRAQDATLPPPAYIALLEGPATLERDGELQAAALNMPLVPGDRLRTTTGQVQIAFADGSGVEVAEYSEIEVLTPTRVRLLAGTMDLLEREVTQGVSTAYLPQDLQTYSGVLDQHGAWGYEASYGNVWYPTVAADWRPYYYGTWAPVPTYGWTWVGVDRWSWPTHHYGRWGYARARWFWIPGRTWGPAWVSWGSTPDYVSWCPLGYDSRPVFSLGFGFGNAWAAWTVLPRTHFGVRGYYAHRYAVDPRRFGSSTRFVSHHTAPIAVPVRNSNRRIADGSRLGTGTSRVVGNRESIVNSRPSGVGTRESALDSRAAAIGRRPSADYRPPTTDNRAQPRAVPRETPSRPGAPPLNAPPVNSRSSAPGASAPQTVAPEYRTPPRGYRTPNGSRATPEAPRAPEPPAYQPPVLDNRRAAPEYRRAPESPRPSMPEYARPRRESQPAASAPPPQRSTPEAAPPRADRPAGARERPSGAPSSGQARPRGDGGAPDRRRPR